MSLQTRIVDHLINSMKFKQKGDWLRDGVCPLCSHKELYVHAENPRVVKCGRINKCGYEEHVKEICEHLFKDWSKEYPKTAANPHAAADAYMRDSRGFDLTKLKNLYTQELFANEYKFPGLISATVRFPIAEGIYWERLIDRPERFGRQKCNIQGKITGHYWTYHSKFDDLCISKEIWLTEGIFNSIALSFADFTTAATISSQNYPSLLLTKIKNRCEELELKTLPTLVWAFDNDIAGKDATLKFHQRAIKDGWTSTAAIPAMGGEKDLDWNDLYERGLLKDENIKKYRHYGQVHIAESAKEAALLIYQYKERNSFYFVHHYETFWCSVDSNKYSEAKEDQIEIYNSVIEAETEAFKKIAKVTNICGAKLKGLYFQRNTVTNEAWYYFSIQRGHRDQIKEAFTSAEITSKTIFKNRLLNSAIGCWWTGSEHQLQTIMQSETNPDHLKEVKTIDYMGYSKEYSSYIFGKYAVHKGRLIHINNQDYFNAGKNEVKTLAHTPVITLNQEKFKPIWWRDNYTINGEKGLIILAWWTGSYFAEQIRDQLGYFPFIEYVGQAGSGKSSYIDFLWKLSGRNDGKEGINPNSSSMVAVHRTMAQVSNLPVVFLEGDRKTGEKVQKQKFDWDELKDAFNGQNIRSRGLKTAGNETYDPPFRGAIMISQNDPMQASEAILTRTLQISVDMAGHTYEKSKIANRLYSIDFDEANRYISHCLINEEKILNTFFEKMAEIEHEYHEKGISHTRIRACHALVSAMIDTLEKHVFKDVIDLDEICDAKRMLENMAKQRMQDLSDDHIYVKQFWEAYEYLNMSRSNAFNLNHYKHDAPRVAINLNEIYKVAARNFQALPDINDMRTLLRSSKKYKFFEMNRAVRSNKYPADDVSTIKEELSEDRVVKCWIFGNPYQDYQADWSDED